MTELTLHGVHEDEEHLVLVDDAGHEYTVAIDERLFAAVRRDRSRLSRLHADGESVRPRDIQAMIRSGMTAEDVSESTGASLTHVRQYEGPVLAERAHVADRAGRVPVFPEGDTEATPTPLSALVRRRLLVREVDPDSMSWDAWKRPDGTWYVELRFVAAGKDRTAGWSFARGAVDPLDDEARWLTDTGPTDSGPIPTFGTAQERDRGIGADAGRTGATGADPDTPTDASRNGRHKEETGRILESLRRRRGRQAAARDDQESAGRPASALPKPARAGGLHAVTRTPERTPDGAHTALSAPEEALDDRVIAVPRPGQAPEVPVRPVALRDAEPASSGRALRSTEYEDLADDPAQLSVLDEPGVAEDMTDLPSNATVPILRREDAAHTPGDVEHDADSAESADGTTDEDTSDRDATGQHRPSAQDGRTTDPAAEAPSTSPSPAPTGDAPARLGGGPARLGGGPARLGGGPARRGGGPAPVRPVGQDDSAPSTQAPATGTDTAAGNDTAAQGPNDPAAQDAPTQGSMAQGSPTQDSGDDSGSTGSNGGNRSKKGRSSVPSWDEIMFGGRRP
ncbi:septation protein SepH [Brevibacterium litoralis]|uniref:septation protein SepH n=1 Tax=Brevibacterium litoralis TaxID=3138935 RepID=UPI0032ECC57E